jgi:hypothetical protein
MVKAVPRPVLDYLGIVVIPLGSAGLTSAAAIPPPPLWARRGGQAVTFTEDPGILTSFGSRIRASRAQVTDGNESRHDEEQGEEEKDGQRSDHSHGDELHKGMLKKRTIDRPRQVRVHVMARGISRARRAYGRRTWPGRQDVQYLAAGTASSRSVEIRSSQLPHRPYVPASTRASAASVSSR